MGLTTSSLAAGCYDLAISIDFEEVRDVVRFWFGDSAGTTWGS
jgi:hypothetical protein